MPGRLDPGEELGLGQGGGPSRVQSRAPGGGEVAADGGAGQTEVSCDPALAPALLAELE
ncbi:MAG: hypothetical protein M0T72_00200 [Candidatus Dormibacteraeota bacterium]|nr:hypothetical protein [Candidatus Dormibacteraeota bacterium]